MVKAFPCLLILASPFVRAADVWFSGAQEIEFAGEVLSASDILVQSYDLGYSGTEDDWLLDTTFGLKHYDVDYAPVLFGNDQALSETTSSINLGLTREWSDTWSGSMTLGAYDGYSDFRSIWIAEYYNQLFGAFSSYHGPDPNGQSISLGADWDYQPGTGLAAFRLGYGRDEIAPGWGFDSAIGQPEAGRDVLHTLSGALVVEQLVNPWLKTDLSLSARQTTDRDPRFGVVNSWAAAKGPLAVRLTGGFTYEAPSFDAVYGSVLGEWNFHPRWFARIGVRIYSDSGEIEASDFNALAPAVDTTEIFTNLLWDSGDISLLAGVGLLDTNYAALSEDNEFFGNLYRDRDWWTFRLAASFRF
jgi:hypothetical protein